MPAAAEHREPLVDADPQPTSAATENTRHALLQALHPHGYRDLRAFRDKTKRTTSVPADNLAGVDAFADQHRDLNVFFGVAPRTDNKGRNTNACSALHALFTDHDFKDTPEHEVRARLAAFAHPPSAIVASGGGLHSYWFLTEPLDIARAKLLLRALAKALGADLNAAEPARVLRLPGTVNYKYNPPRLVVVESLNNMRRYSAVAIAQALPATDRTDDIPTPTVLPPLISHGHRHDALFHEGCRLRQRGYAEPEIADVLWSLLKHRNDGPEVPRENIDELAQDICQRYKPEFVKYTEPKSRAGQIVPDHQGNIRLALAQLGLDLSYNAFAAKDLASFRGVTQFLDDVVVQRAWLQLDDTFKFRPSLHFFEIVVKDEARRHSFHPVLDYLNQLKWDGEPRINSWLRTYGGAVDTASECSEEQSYLEAVSSTFLIAAVRRVRTPGCKFDEMLVLEAPQGTLKSSALRVLCPDDNWFSDDLPLGVSAKEIIECTAGKWIIEASELQGYTNAQVDHLKSMMARQTDGPVRLAYGHFSVEVPRQFLMVGTTNKLAEYLRDSTGNRRFWPVRVTKFDVAALRRDRDQLWAEAAYREATGESIRLPEELWAAAAVEQDARRQVDPWEELLGDSSAFSLTTDEAVLVETLWAALGDAGKYFKRNDADRLAMIMQRFGFTRKKKIDVIHTTVTNGTEKTADPVRRWAWVREGTDPSRIEIRRTLELS